MANKLVVSLSPHVHSGDSVQKNMYWVCIALVPALLCSFVSFGVDLTTVPDEETFAYYQLGDVHHFVQNGYLLRFDGEKTLGLYRFAEDMLLEHNLLEEADPETEAIASRMEIRLKAYLQQLLARIVQDRLTLPDTGRDED